MFINLRENLKNCFYESTKSVSITEAKNSGINVLKKENINYWHKEWQQQRKKESMYVLVGRLLNNAFLEIKIYGWLLQKIVEMFIILAKNLIVILLGVNRFGIRLKRKILALMYWKKKILTIDIKNDSNKERKKACMYWWEDYWITHF